MGASRSDSGLKATPVIRALTLCVVATNPKLICLKEQPKTQEMRLTMVPVEPYLCLETGEILTLCNAEQTRMNLQDLPRHPPEEQPLWGEPSRMHAHEAEAHKTGTAADMITGRPAESRTPRLLLATLLTRSASSAARVTSTGSGSKYCEARAQAADPWTK